MYIFSSLSVDFTIACYITLFCKEFPFKGHSLFDLQLRVHLICADDLLIIFLLCFLICCVMFKVQLYLIFSVPFEYLMENA